MEASEAPPEKRLKKGNCVKEPAGNSRGDDKSEEAYQSLYEPYYSANFKFILETVILNNPHHGHGVTATDAASSSPGRGPGIAIGEAEVEGGGEREGGIEHGALFSQRDVQKVKEFVAFPGKYTSTGIQAPPKSHRLRIGA